MPLGVFFVVLFGATPAWSQPKTTTTPGEAPSNRSSLAASAAGPSSGLQVIVNERGRVTQSGDAVGTGSSTGQAQIVKPAGATVRRAVLAAASTGFRGPIQGNVSLDGSPVTFTASTPSSIASVNYWADVTDRVRGKLNAAPAGAVTFDIGESVSSSVDGVILNVIFDDPSQTTDRSVSFLFGALQTAGDNFRLTTDRPINKIAPGFVLQMGLGISFGFQGGAQYSQVDVNGQRLTSSAGGQDDGEGANGALITFGGEGDSPTNPADPNAFPTNARSDDELYDLVPFVQNGDNEITINTQNPSSDDNIFFASLTTNPPVARIETSKGFLLSMLVMGDSYSAGNGAGNYYGAEGCRRSSNNYARQYERKVEVAPYFQRSFVENVACSGDTTWEFFFPKSGRPPQEEWVNDGYDLIFLTIGGNDLGFKQIVQQCLIQATDNAAKCKSRLSDAETKLDDGTLKARVARVLASIRHRAHTRAKIILLGYPHLEGNPRYELEGVKVGERVRRIADRGDQKQQEIVNELNAANPTKGRSVFVKTKGLFAGPPSHELRSEFINPNGWFIEPTNPFVFDTWYHPNYTGWLEEAGLLYRDPRVPKYDLNSR